MRTVVALLLLAAGCGGSEEERPEGTSDTDAAPGLYEATAERLWAPDHVVEIAFEVEVADGEALAAETNDLFQLLYGADCVDNPWAGPFNWYPADVTVDGVRVEQVGIRKKGLIGSLSTDKPSLKIKFDKYVEGQQLDGVERMTLNNAVSDPSLLNQCLGYQLFRDAGIAAPRCNFAHVTVNGDDLGVYVSVEPMKKDWLRWAYDGDDDGDLYEGTVSDFRQGWTDTFEPKTSDTDADRPAVLATRDALELADDAAMFEALEAQVDLAKFYDFWAMEALVGHVDGYAGNTNNYFVYRPEQTNRFEFLPWGIDVIFLEFEAFGSSSSSVVMANSQLTRRLWETPEGQAGYLASVDRLLDEVWDEAALLAEIDRMATLIEPYALVDEDRAAAQDRLRAFVTNRRANVELLLGQPLPTFDEPLRDGICLYESGTLRMDFDTTWDTLAVADPLAEGSATTTGALDGGSVDFTGGAIAGEDSGYASIIGVGLTGATTVHYVAAQLPLSNLHVGTVAIDGFGNQGLLVELDFISDDEQVLASMWDAELVITEWTGVPGSPVRGYLEGTLYGGGPF